MKKFVSFLLNFKLDFNNNNNLANKQLSYAKLLEYKSSCQTCLEQELKDNTAKTCESPKTEKLINIVISSRCREGVSCL